MNDPNLTPELTPQDSLTAFLRARLDEDEAAARKAIADESPAWQAVSYDHGTEWGVRDTGDVWVTDRIDQATAEHIARHDPARVLREVVAGRAIVALHDVNSEPERWGDSPNDRALRGQPTGRISYWCDTCDDDRDYGHIGGPQEGCDTVRHLAAVYSDHPDYREDWKP